MIVTVSASYGAGGSVVGPELARRLGVPFLSRATTSTGDFTEPGSANSDGAADGASEGGSATTGGSSRHGGTERLAPGEAGEVPAHRLLAALTHAMPVGPTQSPPPARHLDESLRHDSEADIHRLTADGAGVILGRGAAVVLGKDKGFHVRLDGPAELRVVQGATIERLGEDEARRHMAAADRARTAYVRRLYRADPTDAAHYHLVIDSTAIPLDVVVEVIIQAVRARESGDG
jgi:cytidylate kinase